jgi:hypothetical protein
LERRFGSALCPIVAQPPPPRGATILRRSIGGTRPTEILAAPTADSFCG